MMLRKFFGTLALACIVFSAPAHASVVYDFTFNNSNDGGGTVDGTITLPSSADGLYAATSVVVISNTAGFGLGQYVVWDATGNNQFLVSGGQIVPGDPSQPTEFSDFGNSTRNPSLGVTCCSLTFSAFDSILDGGLSDSNGTVTVGFGSPVTFTLATTPIPATLPLFAAGIAGLGLLGWRRKRKMQSVIA